MTTTKLYTQNNYETTMVTPVLLSSGDIEVEVQVAPTYTRGFVFLGPASNPERAYFYNVVGNILFIAGPSRLNASTHAIGDPVTIANSAELINRLEDNSIKTHTPEITGMLTVNVFGGSYIADGQEFTDADQEFTVLNNTTTYFYFRHSTNTVEQGYILADIQDNTNAEYGKLLFTVTTAGGAITAIDVNQPRVYNDYNSLVNGGVNTNTPTLTNSYINTLSADSIDVGALIPIYNSGDTVDKKVTIADLFAHAEAQGYITPGAVGYAHVQSGAAATWTITHNLNTTNTTIQVFDNSNPAGELMYDTIQRNLNSIVLTFAGNAVAGSAIVMAPSGNNSVPNPTVDLIAGEDLGQAKMVRMGISGRSSGINASYVPSPDTTNFDTVSSSKFLYQTFKAQRAGVTKVALFAKKTAAPDTTDLTIEIYATTTQTIGGHVYNTPTGSALGTATIASGSLSTTAAWVTGTLGVAITNLTPGSYYAIKVIGVGAQNVLIGYGDDTVDYNTNGFQFISSLSPISGDYAYKVQHADLVAEVTSKVYLTSAFETATGVKIGATKLSALSGNTASIEPQIATAFSGLSEGLQYYLSDIAGEISLTPGTNSIAAGVPLSTSSLIIR